MQPRRKHSNIQFQQIPTNVRIMLQTIMRSILKFFVKKTKMTIPSTKKSAKVSKLCKHLSSPRVTAWLASALTKNLASLQGWDASFLCPSPRIRIAFRLIRSAAAIPFLRRIQPYNRITLANNAGLVEHKILDSNQFLSAFSGNLRFIVAVFSLVVGGAL